MKRLNVWFTDFSCDDVGKINEYKWLVREYNVNLCKENPDFVIASTFGDDHLKYRNAIKILISGENISPDFNVFDYAVTSDPIEFGDRHVRIPYWALRNLVNKEYETGRRVVKDKSQLLKRKFCNFLYSNSSTHCAMPAREELFNVISSYKRVDSGGSFLNNLGGVKVIDKQAFIGSYKFTIACENSIKPGYSTEKIIDPMLVNSIPIYLGDPEIANEFNSRAFINVADFKNMEELLEYIKYIDNNDEEYLQMLSEPIFAEDRNLVVDYHELYEGFLRHIFDQKISSARRRCEYGWSRYYEPRPLRERVMNVIQLRYPKLAGCLGRFVMTYGRE